VKVYISYELLTETWH